MPIDAFRTYVMQRIGALTQHPLRTQTCDATAAELQVALHEVVNQQQTIGRVEQRAEENCQTLLAQAESYIQAVQQQFHDAAQDPIQVSSHPWIRDGLLRSRSCLFSLLRTVQNASSPRPATDFRCPVPMPTSTAIL